MKQLLTITLLLFAFASHATRADNHADAFAATKAKLEAAMKNDIRTDAEIARDSNRKPLDTLDFFGLRDDMKIVELVPGGGWYTKLLVPTVAEKGEYYAAFGTGRIKDRLVRQCRWPMADRAIGPSLLRASADGTRHGWRED